MTKIKCLKCGDIIFGEKLNERVWCKCGLCSIKEGKGIYSISGDPEDFEVYNQKKCKFETARQYFELPTRR